MLTFDEFARKVVLEAEPCSQNTARDNLGFGWLYYGMIRNYAPKYVIAIGSRRGFMPFCAARAVKDNGHGKVIFIDPSYIGEGDPGWGGRGLWSEPAKVEERIAAFELRGWITHLKMTSEEAVPLVRQIIGDEGDIGLIIDGSHKRDMCLKDFRLYSQLIHQGFVMFHDATNPDCEVDQALSILRADSHEFAVMQLDAGLAITTINRASHVRRG